MTDHSQHHVDHDHRSGLNAMAANATLHCLTGCAIGEILGLMIGTAAGLDNGVTIALSVALAFVFGFSLSTLPLLNAGLGFFAALSIVFAADTLSIATMELVDNAVMALIPGALDAGLVNPTFWIAMMIALSAAFVAAYPVNRFLLTRGKGHALTMQYHQGHAEADDADGVATSGRRRYPDLSTNLLVTAIVAFMIGGLVVSIADELENDDPAEPAPHGAATIQISDPA